MKITNGLFDNMVLQRASNGHSDALIDGETTGRGRILATVRRGHRAVKDFSGRPVGTGKKNCFSVRLRGLPAGGPYEIELTTADGTDRITVADVWVGDVWIAGGQSNMCGTGGNEAPAVPHPMVMAFYNDDTWRPAVDPIHDHYRCVDPIHVKCDGGEAPNPGAPSGPGLALTFAMEMQRLTGIPQGVIACAHGGTGMDVWNPSLKHLGGNSLYGAMLRRIRRNGGRVAGLLWYQGEAETAPNWARIYTRRMERFVAEFRADVGDPHSPVAIMQLCRTVQPGDYDREWTSVREQQRTLSSLIPRLTVVPTIDLTLGDLIHLDGRSNIRLGQRAAQAMHDLREKNRTGLTPITLKRVTWEAGWCQSHVLVEFDNVVDKLAAAERPAGFSIQRADGSETAFDVTLEGRIARVKSTVPTGDIEGCTLYYGFGGDPYCNIHDGAGRSLPAFGPISIPGPRIRSPFIHALRVSQPLPADPTLVSLEPIDRLGDIELAIRVFDGDFCNCRDVITDAGSADTAILFSCDFVCDEVMDIAVLLGSDGPLKVWVDGKLKLHVPTGQCPARADGHAVKLTRLRGRHQLLVALGSNRREAWGLFLRFERRARAGGPTAVRLPRIIG